MNSPLTLHVHIIHDSVCRIGQIVPARDQSGNGGDTKKHTHTCKNKHFYSYIYSRASQRTYIFAFVASNEESLYSWDRGCEQTLNFFSTRRGKQTSHVIKLDSRHAQLKRPGIQCDIQDQTADNILCSRSTASPLRTSYDLVNSVFALSHTPSDGTHVDVAVLNRAGNA
jgi:hypothetical protein